MNAEQVIFKTHKKLMAGYSQLLLNYDLQIEAPLPDVPKILIANHPTTTDPFLLPLLVNEPITILVTQEAFDVPLFGRALRLGGHIPVPDRLADRSGESIIAEAVNRLRGGGNVGVFPEGSLSPEVGRFCPPRTGAARIALLSQAPVIPVGIHLSRDAYLRIHYKSDGRIACRGDYFVTVGQPMSFSGSVEDQEWVREVSRRMMTAVVAQAEKSLQRMRASYEWRIPDLIPTSG